eukprot:5581516-Prorocentrum_lima.AAC.1
MVTSLRGGRNGASGGWGPRKPPSAMPSVPSPWSGLEDDDDRAVAGVPLALKTSLSSSGQKLPFTPQAGVGEPSIFLGCLSATR